MIVGIALQFVFRQGRVELKHGRLSWLDTIVGGEIAGRGQCIQRGNRGLAGGLEVDQTSVRISARFYRPAFHTTTASAAFRVEVERFGIIVFAVLLKGG